MFRSHDDARLPRPGRAIQPILRDLSRYALRSSGSGEDLRAKALNNAQGFVRPVCEECKRGY